MFRYEISPYENVNNPQYKFYKLYINGVCRFDEFIEGMEHNINDKKQFRSIIAYMDCLTDQNHLPSSKFNHINDSNRDDLYEFKKDKIRVYVIKQKPNCFIVIGGYKSTQKKDIPILKSIIKDFPKAYEI